MFVFNVQILALLSIDCSDVLNLAKGLNLNNKQQTLFESLSINCCSGGVRCDDNNRVYAIDWSWKSLNGKINGTALPPTLLELRLYGNQITGELPNIWPPNLEILDIDDGNSFIGDVPQFPDSLTVLWLTAAGLTGNRLTGTIRLKKPTILYVFDTWITDIIILDTTALSICVITNNPMLGNPNVNSLNSKCTISDLYNASSLPVTRPIYVPSISSVTSSFHQTTTTKPFSANIITTLRLPDHFTTSFLISSSPTDTDSSQYSFELDLNYTSTDISNLNSQDASPSTESTILLFSLIGVLVTLCVLVGIASVVVKHPKVHSKFGRKNSFGTLNTTYTKDTTVTR